MMRNPTSSDHPITACLDALHEQWISFSRAVDARLLIWRAACGERRMVDCFVARSRDAQMTDTRDVFVHLEDSFATPREHGEVLVRALRAHVGAERQGTSWSPPPHSDYPGRPQTLLAALVSLRRYLGLTGDARLSVWLDPADVSAADAYRDWLRALVRSAPSAVRFIVLDEGHDGMLASLAVEDRDRVHRVACSLELPAALEALARQADDGSPGARFRILQARLWTILQAHDAAAAHTVLAEAERLASTAGWPWLAAAMWLTSAGAMLGRGARREALQAYRRAAALSTIGNGATALPSEAAAISSIANFGAGFVLFGEGAHAQAAAAYTTAASRSRARGDLRGELAGHRMASVCHEADGARDDAWETGVRGLSRGHAGEAMTHAAAELALLARHLVGLTRRVARFSARRTPLEARLDRLFGPGWRSLGSVGEVGRLEGRAPILR